MRDAPRQCRLESVRAESADGAFRLTQVEHVARRFAPHFFTTYAVGVVESGACCIETPRGSWVAGPGSFLAFSPRELHRAHVLSDEPYAYRMAYLSAECMGALGVGTRDARGGGLVDLIPVTEPSALSQAFAQAHREVIGDPGAPNQAGQLMRCTRALIAAAVAPAPLRHSARDLTLVETAKAFLAAHIGRPVCLTGVADACGVNEFHLIRVFRRVTGLTPYSYLIVLRVNEARRLLDDGATVSDAVYACRFSDQSHLTRIFKRTIGIPPGLYLRSGR